MHDIVAVRTPEELLMFRELIEEYNTLVCQGKYGFSLDFQNISEELEHLPGRYAPPSGDAFLIFCDNTLAGCCAFRQHTDTCCEVKRMYLREGFRGRHLGRLMLTRVLEAAADAGYSRACCDTMPVMAQALALYRSAGFIPTAPYHQHLLPGAVCLEKEL